MIGYDVDDFYCVLGDIMVWSINFMIGKVKNMIGENEFVEII